MENSEASSGGTSYSRRSSSIFSNLSISSNPHSPFYSPGNLYPEIQQEKQFQTRVPIPLRSDIIELFENKKSAIKFAKGSKKPFADLGKVNCDRKLDNLCITFHFCYSDNSNLNIYVFHSQIE